LDLRPEPIPIKGANVYGATKAFVEQFTLNLKADLLGTAVRVTNIEPAMVGDSEFSLVRFKGNKNKADEVYEGLKPLSPADIFRVRNLGFILTCTCKYQQNRNNANKPGPFFFGCS
jgi:NADP-dependent 3-hydroxy acid dehydrogenase YdfG